MLTTLIAGEKKLSLSSLIHRYCAKLESASRTTL